MTLPLSSAQLHYHQAAANIITLLSGLRSFVFQYLSLYLAACQLSRYYSAKKIHNWMFPPTNSSHYGWPQVRSVNENRHIKRSLHGRNSRCRNPHSGYTIYIGLNNWKTSQLDYASELDSYSPQHLPSLWNHKTSYKCSTILQTRSQWQQKL